MEKNTGKSFEEEVYKIISQIVKENRFMVSFPNVRILRKPRYYSKDRGAEIEFDISVEKYLDNPDENENMRPSIIIIIECKDYSKSIPVDDVEEFHAKLQQIGADNTKGMMITQNGCFQRSTLTYAESKGIALARILPSNQVHFAMFCRIDSMLAKGKMTEKEKREIAERRIKPLIEKNYISYNQHFYSSAEDDNLEHLIVRLFGIDYFEYLFPESKEKIIKGTQ